MPKMGLQVWLGTIVLIAALALYEVIRGFVDPRPSVLGAIIMSTAVVGILTWVIARFTLLRYQRLMAATERTNRLLQAVLGAMREGVLILNPDGTIAMHNPAMEEIFRWSQQPPAPLRLVDITRDPIIHDAFRAAFNNGLSSERHVRIHTPELRVFQVHITPLAQEPNGPALGAVGVFFDISKLERLEQVRREFFANLSHELRTPLTSILAYVETLLDGAISDPENNVLFLKIVQKHALRMQRLAGDISDLSAVESGEVRLEMVPVGLKSFVGNILSLSAARAEAAGVTLQANIPADLQVMADPHRMEQILGNLVDNAIKFNRKGGSVQLGAYADRANVFISVSDTGVGIAPADRARIFERFYRVDKSRSREIGGSGLGLAIVKHLAQLHGGEISVESTPNRGSTFMLKLMAPVAPSPQESKVSE